jgi:hypothetical protein
LRHARRLGRREPWIRDVLATALAGLRADSVPVAAGHDDRSIHEGVATYRRRRRCPTRLDPPPYASAPWALHEAVSALARWSRTSVTRRG